MKTIPTACGALKCGAPIVARISAMSFLTGLVPRAYATASTAARSTSTLRAIAARAAHKVQSMNERQSRTRAPRAASTPLTTVHHGVARVDDYAWLRAANWQTVMRDPSLLDPSIRAHLEAENAYAKAIMAD